MTERGLSFFSNLSSTAPMIRADWNVFAYLAALSYNNFDACIQAKSSRWQRTQAYLLVCAGLQMSEGVPVCWSPDKRTGCRATLCALSVYAGRDSRVSHLWFILQTNKSRQRQIWRDSTKIIDINYILFILTPTQMLKWIYSISVFLNLSHDLGLAQ